MNADVGYQIDETGWERAYAENLLERLGPSRVAGLERDRIQELVREILAPFMPTEYEVNQIANAVTAKLRDYVPPADSPPPQSREERLYR